MGSVLFGLYLSAEYDTGSGTMIALVAAVIFALIAVAQAVNGGFIRSDENFN